MLVTIFQIAIPIKFSHTISASNAAQMIKSRFKVDVFVFESFEPEQKKNEKIYRSIGNGLKNKLFFYLWNNNFFANAYNSVSSAFSSSIFCRWSGLRLFIVELETVALCCSNGIAKRRLNVSSKTYWEICKVNEWRRWVVWLVIIDHIQIAVYLLKFSQSKVGHSCQISFSTCQHNTIPFVWSHRWLIVAANKCQIR